MSNHRDPPYSDAERLSVAIDAVRNAKKQIRGALCTQAAEACMKDTEDALDLLTSKFNAALDLIVAEIDRLEGVEVAQ